MPLLKVQEPGEANAAIKAMSRGNRFANSIRPLNRHTPPSLILALDYAQQLSPSINVELVGGLEVFGQHGIGVAHCGQLLQSGVTVAY
jgi:hypothetical protein